MNTTIKSVVASANHAAVDMADKALSKAGDGLDTLQDGVDELRDDLPSAHSKLTRMAIEADALARRGIARARDAADTARQKAAQAGESTVGYIQDQPVKSVLIAAATGAAIAAVVAWATRPTSKRY